MADLIIQNPSITPNVFEYDEAGRVSAISGYPLAGGGGGTIVKSDLMWKPNVGNDGYVRWTLASSATTPGEAYISGAQGPAGPQGVSGTPGKNPEFQINPTDAHWQWRYSGDTNWTDLGVVASGAIGPQGLSGDDGKDGISPKVRINLETNKWEISEDDGKTWTSTNVSATGPAGEDGKDGASGTNGRDGISPTVSTSAIPGGNRVIFTYDNDGTTATESIDVMSGVSGAKGSDGISPTVELTPIQDQQYPQGGWNVTITDKDHQSGQTFQIFNGIDGQGATVDLNGGTGIQVSHQAGTTDYIISVSADYALKSYVDSASANAYDKAVAQIPDDYITKDVDDLTYYYKKTETSGANELATEFAKYVTSSNVTTQDKDYVMTTTGWKVLTLPGGGMTEVIHDTTLTGQGNDANSKLGVAWSTLSGNTIAFANSADVAMRYYDTIDKAPISLSQSINALYSQLDNCLLTGDIMPDNGISGIYNSQAQEFELGLTQTAYNAVTSVSSKVDKPTTSLVDKYLVLRTDNAGNVSGWCDFQDQSYSKSEADGRYQKKADMSSYLTTAQYETDSAKYVLTGDILTAANNKLTGIKIGSTSYEVPTTDLSNYYTKSETSATGELNTEFAKKLDSSIAASTYQTKDDMSAYVAVTGDQMTGQLELSGSNYDDYYLKVVRQNVNGHARFGLGGGGGAVIKSVDGTNNAQMLVKSNATSGIEILLQKNSNEYIGNLIPMIVEAAGWTPTGNDYKLHIVLDS